MDSVGVFEVKTFHSEVLVAGEASVDVMTLEVVISEQQLRSETDLTQLTDNLHGTILFVAVNFSDMRITEIFGIETLIANRAFDLCFLVLLLVLFVLVIFQRLQVGEVDIASITMCPLQFLHLF